MGLFAKQAIQGGEIIGIKGGHILDWSSVQKYVAKEEKGSYCQIEEDMWLASTTSDEANRIQMNLNHSCDPNVGLRGQITYVAMRDIKADEALTMDYAFVITRPKEYKLECNCGAKQCRKVVTANDWKLTELQEKYGPYFASFIQEKIRELNSKQ